MSPFQTTSTPEDLIRLAESALEAGEPDLTLELCQTLLATQPDNLEAKFLEAEAWRDLREPEEAEARYRSLMTHRNADPSFWSGLGSACFDLGKVEEALRCFHRALQLNPSHGASAYGRAMVRERLGDEAGATRDYTRAAASDEAYPVPIHMSDSDVAALLSRALESVEPSVRALVETSRLVIEALPPLDICAAYEPPCSPADLLGHFAAIPGGSGWSRFPPTLVLYRRNLERWASSPDALVEGIRVSLLEPLSAWVHSPTDEA
ncbi:MAG: tetratricopeptide repeat protein [Myxococcota bacterium]